MKKVSLATWIQLLGMSSVVAGLVFVGLEMQQTQRIALATETSNRMYQVLQTIRTSSEVGLDWNKVVFSEYLKVADFFVKESQKAFLNAILEKVSKVSRDKNG